MRAPSTTLRAPSTTLLAPSTAPRAPTTALRAPKSTLRAPKSTLRAPSTALSAPSTALSAPSTTLRAPSTTLRAPKATLRAPSTALLAPSTALPAPSTTLRAPSTALLAPKATLRAPSTALLAPSTALPAPKATLRAPSTTLRAPKTTLRAPSTTLRAPKTALRAPKTTLRAPSTTLRAPKATLRAPSTALRAPPATAIRWAWWTFTAPRHCPGSVARPRDHPVSGPPARFFPPAGWLRDAEALFAYGAPMSEPAVRARQEETPPTSEPAGPPPSGEAEDVEHKWLREVYQGDNVPQLTVRAVVMGLLLGSFMAFSNLYVGLKTGWGLGVAITACIMSWAIFKALRPILGSEPSILENNCMQSTASAAGYSTGSTLISAFGAYMMINKTLPPWPIIMALVFSLAMLGVFMAIPMKRNMVNIEQLPFPSGMAAAETLRSLYTAGEEAIKKARSLFAGIGVGAIIAFLRDGMADFTERFKWGSWAGWLTLPNFLPVSDWLKKAGATNAAIVFDPKGYTFSFELSTILVGAGAIMGIRVATSMLVGAFLCYGVLAPIMHHTAGAEGHMVIEVLGYRSIVSWSVWGGVSLMTTAALLNFGLQWRTLARALSGVGAMFKKKDESTPNDPLERIEVPSSWFLIGTGVAGALCVLINWYAFHIAIWLGALAVVISAVLAIVACRATGETDTTPIGALGKITQLTYGLLIPQNITANLMTANVTASIASASADLLTDLKSGYLLGANPRKQFLAQFFGVFAGTLVAVPGFFLLVPNANVLGGDKFPAPSAQVWKAVAELLGKGVHSLDPTALWAMAVGGALGIVITLLEKAFPKHRHLIPSPTGIGLAFVIPAWNSMSMFLGALIAWVLEKKRPATAETYTIPVASGIIAGESLMGVFVAVFGVVSDLMK